jgi:hypothetical protein
MGASSWTVVEPSLPALTCTYSFGPGTANALAVAVDGGVVVVSPPFKPEERVFTELEKHGPVRALVAPNAFHHMGVAAWKARYPEAAIFAPAQSIARVAKKTKLTGIQPLAEAAKLTGDRVELIDMPHYKTGEALVRWRTSGGAAWYVTDILMNLPPGVPGLVGRIFRVTRSAPGLRRNALAGVLMIKDKRALYAWLVEQAEKAPPQIIVTCHGEPVKLADPVADIRAACS